VLRDVDLDIPSGRVTALVGPSGCGKTSFLHCLNRIVDLIPGCRVQGSVLFHGTDIYRQGTDVARLRLRIGQIFQRPNPFPTTIRKNIQLALREHGIRDRTELDARTTTALADVGLLDEVKGRLDSPATALSGGQQQRLCIARAIALEPEVLLMDEPCSALDPMASEVVEGLIQGFRDRYTVIIVTHNLAQARRVADEIAVFWSEDGVGVLVESGTASRVLTAPQDRRTADYVRGARG
jgi:phosphate transport system ATP-binding protein